MKGPEADADLVPHRQMQPIHLTGSKPKHGRCVQELRRVQDPAVGAVDEGQVWLVEGKIGEGRVEGCEDSLGGEQQPKAQ